MLEVRGRDLKDPEVDGEAEPGAYSGSPWDPESGWMEWSDRAFLPLSLRGLLGARVLGCQGRGRR